MNLQKLALFVDKEMPHGLKKYLELELFPQIQMKVGKGISISTACQWLWHEGFVYIEHKKALYYDGHDHPNVVEYCQIFLPAMEKYQSCLVEYQVGQVDIEVEELLVIGEWKLVLLAHDESTNKSGK